MEESVKPLPLTTVNLEKHTFKEATKQIATQRDMNRFGRSQAYFDLLNFLVVLNEAVRDKQISDPCPESDGVHRIIKVLDELEEWIKEIPPIQQPMRYGNKAYRIWHERLQKEAPDLLKKLVDNPKEGTIEELTPYFRDSFGNSTRIDYGTGHETTFVAFLLCLQKIHVFKENDAQALVTRVFARYIKLMRRIQITYLLEPAGSHGVWSLDDYCFLPFYWGSSQLSNHRTIKPASIHDSHVIAQFSDEYLYLDSIRFICKMKSGPFGEHSPILNDVSVVPKWDKVNSGMLKMYKVEVLSKFPIMQHFFFGSILSLDPVA